MRYLILVLVLLGGCATTNSGELKGKIESQHNYRHKYDDTLIVSVETTYRF